MMLSSSSLPGCQARLQLRRPHLGGLFKTGASWRLPTRVRKHALRSIAVPRAELKTAKGIRFLPEQLVLRSVLGEGSFGEVFEGLLTSSRGEQRVIMKRVKDRVQGAAEMHEMEHLLNVYASKASAKSVADFLGYCEVEETRNKLTRGLWLVWAYQGSRTLAYYLKRRDCIQALANDLRVSEEVVVPTVMRQIFQCLEDIHAAGVVHRDIKPANIIFCERDRRFKLIDLGAACDLRSGTNYRPTETILDPCYCPPEEYVLPTDAPHLSKQAAPIALAMSPLLWSQHRPDCFDTFSAGIILLQLALPSLRTTTALRNFRGALARADHDINEWRLRGASTLSARQTMILDANDGEGWDLAAALLQPREVETDGNGMVKFVSKGAPRPGASAALKHPFVKRAAASSSSSLSPLANLFGSITGSTASVDTEDDLTPGRAEGSRSGSEPRGAAAPGRKAAGGGFWGGWGGSSSGSGKGSAGAAAAAAAERPAAAGSKGGRKAAAAAAAADEAAASAAGSSGGAKPSLWQRLASKLYDLEARVREETSATERQTTVVQKLRADVASGKASEEALRREEGVLAGMQQALQSSMKELRGLYGAASKFIGSAEDLAAQQGQQAQQQTAAGSSNPSSASGSASSRSRQAGATAAAGAGAGRGRGGEQGPEEGDVVDVEAAPAAPAGGRRGANMGQAVEGLVSAGLKFGGLAMHVANSIAESVKADAEKMQQQAAQQRQAVTSYVDALQQLDPPITGRAKYEEIAIRIPDAQAYASLSDLKRRQAFGAYLDGIRRRERAAKQRATTAFQQLLAEAQLSPDSSWEAFAAVHAADPRFAGLADEAERNVAFAGHLEGLRAAAAAAQRRAEKEAAERERVLKCEADFRVLLQAHEGEIRGGATWAQLKRKIWVDPRFDAVPEPRRLKLFTDYYTILFEAGEIIAPAAAPAAAAAPATPTATAPGAAAAAPAVALAAGGAANTKPIMEEGVEEEEEEGVSDDEAALEQLRLEQAKLKEEYDRLEAKLKEMEQQFKSLPLPALEASAAPPELTALIEEDGKGNMVFHFGSGAPLGLSAAAQPVNGAEPAGSSKGSRQQ